MTASNLIVQSLTTSRNMFERMVADLSPAEYLHRPSPKANCAAWLIGHVLLVDRRVSKLLGGDSSMQELPPGFEKQFSREEGCPEASTFGESSILLPMFLSHRNMLIEQVRAASVETLDKPVEKPNPRFATAGELANFQALHTAMHAGQISLIRRSLGRPPLN